LLAEHVVDESEKKLIEESLHPLKVWKVCFENYNFDSKAAPQSNDVIPPLDKMEELKAARSAFKTPSKRTRLGDLMDVAVDTKTMELPPHINCNIYIRVCVFYGNILTVKIVQKQKKIFLR
jgi:hypothetical protein